MPTAAQTPESKPSPASGEDWPCAEAPGRLVGDADPDVAVPDPRPGVPGVIVVAVTGGDDGLEVVDG